MVAIGGAVPVVVPVVLLASVGLGVLLFALVRAEHDARTETDRETAERRARRDTDDVEGDGDRDGWHR